VILQEAYARTPYFKEPLLNLTVQPPRLSKTRLIHVFGLMKDKFGLFLHFREQFLGA
jgi:hypothetical protein